MSLGRKMEEEIWKGFSVFSNRRDESQNCPQQGQGAPCTRTLTPAPALLKMNYNQVTKGWGSHWVAQNLCGMGVCHPR